MDASKRRLTHLAATQEGVFSRSQARALGVPKRTLDWWINSGDIERLLPRVYALPGTKTSWMRFLWAAYLWCGEGAVVSHRAAAAIHGIKELDGATMVEITVPKLCRSPEGVFLHFNEISDQDVRKRKGFLVTSVARTLLDLCAVIPRNLVLKATKRALRERRVSPEQLVDVLYRHNGRGRNGISVFRSILEEVDAFGVLDSELEDLVMRFLRTRRFSEPVRQHPVPLEGGRHYYIDFAYPQWKIAIEAEGFEVHTRDSWESDIARRNLLVAEGWRIFHTTWADITRRPNQVDRELRRFLRRFGGRDG